MKEQGQVFTLDMLFALILVASFVAVSGQALEMASNQGRSYSTRYSLEMVVNDAADVLVKTSGSPIDWENQLKSLETLGFAKVGDDNRPVPNYIDSSKLSRFAAAIGGDNWDPKNERTDRVIKETFGNTSNFEILIAKKGGNSWYIWPGWKPGENSEAENALEVAAAKRLVYGYIGNVRGESPPLIKATGILKDNVKFWIYPGELEIYDWYIYVENIEPVANPNVKLWINSMPDGTYDYGPILGKDLPATRPEIVGGIENDVDKLTDNQKEQPNFIGVKLTGVPKESMKIYIVAIPAGSNPDVVSEMVRKEPHTLQVKIWR